ncbi:hypothetical protein [Halomonas sp. hl-4]|uniref:hypothetical protein n=1 Tax=Halomonas sp. hl-4 TaxID=1761789 RepID=UPI000BB89239|nr:hypothetical protein [Halomonas sp. hl-4]SNY95527.1 hypothetical protein SAMN04488142_0027 [Halomonas sp. hl-4]
MNRERKIQQRADAIVEAVRDGQSMEVALFADYLDKVGDLTSEIEALTPTTTVADMVEAYIKPVTGQRVLSEWARDVAENDQAEIEEDEAERRAA